MKDREDVHADVTGKIVAAIEAGVSDWSLPWRRAGTALHLPRNTLTNKRYRGINIVTLWAAAQERGYSQPIWGTYKQWQERGCQVQGGEKGSIVVLYKEFEIELPPDADPRDDGKRMFARASWVFNADQVEGYKSDAAPAPSNAGPVERLAAADAYICNTRASIRHGGDSAHYVPSLDYIQMPSEGLFIGDQQKRRENYYSTLLHELTHWTGHKSRLDRIFHKRFGDNAYAMEELVAELGAAFLCAHLGIANEPRDDHAKYLAYWLAILKSDSRAIFTAAAKASAAIDHLYTLQQLEMKHAA